MVIYFLKMLTNLNDSYVLSENVAVGHEKEVKCWRRSRRCRCRWSCCKSCRSCQRSWVVEVVKEVVEENEEVVEEV